MLASKCIEGVRILGNLDTQFETPHNCGVVELDIKRFIDYVR
jgi:hypothetical protein